MTEPAYYYLAEVESLFRISRDSLTRWARAGIFVIQGQNRGRRVTGPSVRAALRRLEQGEDLWQSVKESEERAARAAQPTARARSTKTVTGNGGISPQPTEGADSPVFEPLASKPPAWLKKII